MPRLIAGLVALYTIVTGPAFAQDTRAAALAAERAERARQLRAYEPNRIEQGFLYIDEKHLLERLAAPPEGVYPRFGGLPSGNGLTFGPGYRLGRVDAGAWLDAVALWSHRNSKGVALRTGLAGLAGGQLTLEGGVAWHDLAQQDFWGLGGDTAPVARTTYRQHDTTVDLGVSGHPLPWLTVTPSGGQLAAHLGAGRDTGVPSASDRFDEATAPGIDTAVRLGFVGLSVDADFRDAPLNTRGGGRYRAAVTRYSDRRGGPYDFARVDAELLQVFPIFDKKRNFAVHVVASSAQPVSAGDAVPFYLMPWLGGSHSIRGLRNYRLRDRSALLVTGEYRWEAFAGLDMALFLDAGDVAPRWRDIVVGRMKTSAGIGFRFNTNRNVFLRLDTAWGREGARFYMKFGPVF
ncbi:MAG: BamA/TamA family outer membrane protein [Vicinamibacterales bacterium]